MTLEYHTTFNDSHDDTYDIMTMIDMVKSYMISRDTMILEGSWYTRAARN
jgi:hypothetical protein